MPHLDPAPSPVVRLRSAGVDLGGRAALRPIDLDAVPGEIFVVCGANGAGKSTLAEVVAGCRRPSSGSRSGTASVAFVPQRAAIPEGLPVSVRDVVLLGVWGRVGLWRRVGAPLRSRVAEAAERLGVAALLRRPFSQLSGGQRQRTLLASALVRGAELLVLDEPTTGLDDTSARVIREVMRAEADRGVAVLCVSHDPEVIAGADRLLRLEDGRAWAGSGACRPAAFVPMR